MNLIGSNTMHTDHNLHRNEIVDNFSVLASHHIEELQSKESSSSIPILSRSPSSFTISSSSSSTQSRTPLKQQTFDNETVPNLIANASSSLIPFDPAFRNTLNHHHPDLQENDEQQRNPNHRDQRDRNNLNDLLNNQPHENHQDENDDDDNNDNNENGDGLDDEDHEFNLVSLSKKIIARLGD
ncbi:hypothetical protein NH340_JMT00330 [Sarcoptes scabiei]|nr:hypothetical protein NH340_JMT00330 [Sarcoptes scabiei]